MRDYLLTIGITSYNRISELKRCLESIDCKQKDVIEILVSEDKSPKRNEIHNIMTEFLTASEYSVVLNENSSNLGYDRNLKRIIELAHGKYVLFLSDDDKILPNGLNAIIDILTDKNYGAVYAPFHLTDSNEYRRKYTESYTISPGYEYVSKHIYDGILFSGLIFNREYVSNIDAERFLNKNYFQIYMFIYCLYKYGGYYCNVPLIECVGDGVNGFGLSESSEKNELLANRKSIFSNLEYHKGLFSVIRMFDVDYETNIFAHFEKEYRIHSISGLCAARKLGRGTLNQYWSHLKGLDIKIGVVPRVYYSMLYLFGPQVTMCCLCVPRKIIQKSRNEER